MTDWHESPDGPPDEAPGRSPDDAPWTAADDRDRPPSDGMGPAAPDGEPREASARPPHRPVFALAGRAAPGLYVAGWLLSAVGLGLILVAILAARGTGPAGLVLFVAGTVALTLGLVAASGAQAFQRRADGLAYPGPSPFLVFGADFALVNLVYAPIFLVGRQTGLLGASTPAGVLVSILVSTLVYVALLRLLVVGTGGLSWRAMGVHRPDGATVRDLAMGVSTAVPVYLGTLILAVLLSSLLRTAPESPVPLTRDPIGLGLDLLAAAVLAPLGEELFFRGFATTAWLRAMGPSRAIVRGALFFALVHVINVSGTTFDEALARAVIAFVTRLPVALALGQLYVARRSLYASFALHATFNALGLVLGALAGSR
ncbi:MAG TPA: type II CAAX endopeptidase family protein [Candidatus Limnocylindrales bacterium]